MKKIFVTLLISVSIFTIQAQQKPVTKPAAATTTDSDHDGHNHAPITDQPVAPVVVNPNAAKLIFKAETYEFGEIPEGPQVTHEFKFTNTGKEPLILSNVKASCGCTTPSWPKEPILPGKDAVILVTYNTQGRPGNFNKNITITSNADTPNKVIYIKGNVVKAEPEKSVPMEQPSMLSPKN